MMIEKPPLTKPPGRSLLALSCATAIFAGATTAGGMQQQVDFRADVELVLLHVAVVDPRGGEVPPLSAEDFKIYDNGAQRSIELFLTPTDAPLDIALVLDSSASMAPVESIARRAATAFLGRLDLNDCVYVLPFADGARGGRWGRSGDPALYEFIDDIHASGGTALYDALLQGLARLERTASGDLVARGTAAEASEGPDAPAAAGPPPPAPPERTEAPPPASPGPPLDLPPPKRPSLLRQADAAIRDLELDTPPPVTGCGASRPTDPARRRRQALIVLSDGADEDSDATFYEALAAARTASVPVFPVALGYANNDPGLKARLAELARATGGRLIENSAPVQLGAAYDDVVALLRSYYLIGYEPPAASGPDPDAAAARRQQWHDVRVELRRPNFEALVRPGYYR